MKWCFTKGKPLQNRFIGINEEFAFIAYTDEMRAMPVPTEGKWSCFKDMIYFKCNLDGYQLQ